MPDDSRAGGSSLSESILALRCTLMLSTPPHHLNRLKIMADRSHVAAADRLNRTRMKLSYDNLVVLGGSGLNFLSSDYPQNPHLPKTYDVDSLRSNRVRGGPGNSYSVISGISAQR